LFDTNLGSAPSSLAFTPSDDEVKAIRENLERVKSRVQESDREEKTVGQRMSTTEIVEHQLYQTPKEAVAELVGPEGLPYVRMGSRPHWRVILASDRSRYESRGFMVVGIHQESAESLPMLLVSPSERRQ